MVPEPLAIVPAAVEEEPSVDAVVPVALVDRLPDELVPLLVVLPESELLDEPEAVLPSDGPPLALFNVTLPTAMSWLCGGVGNTWPSMLDVDAVLIVELAPLDVPLVLRLPLVLALMELVVLLDPIVQLAVPVDAAW